MSHTLRRVAVCSLAIGLGAYARSEHRTVRPDSLKVYREMSAGSPVVTTLRHGETVQVDWEVAGAKVNWCSVSRPDAPAPLGFVICDELDKQAGEPSAPQREPAAAPAEPRSLARPQRAWALAASALLTERNHGRHDLLEAGPPTETYRRTVSGLLVRWWGIRNRTDLLETLKWLDQTGHRQEFTTMAESLSLVEPGEFKALLAADELSAQDKHSLMVVWEYRGKLGAKSLVGWDYARYISLCRWGYAVGYMTEGEAWQSIMHAARIIQKTFTSWRELGENYLIGREFWSQDEMQKTGTQHRAAYKWLLRDPRSPWNRIPWNLDLR
jgi:hypothetical protein